MRGREEGSEERRWWSDDAGAGEVPAPRGGSPRERGRGIAARRRAALLSIAREAAEILALAHPRRLCSADDVALFLCGCGYRVSDLGNAAGSIFRGGPWRSTPLRVRSVRRRSRSRELKVWRLGRPCDGEDGGEARAFGARPRARAFPTVRLPPAVRGWRPGGLQRDPAALDGEELDAEPGAAAVRSQRGRGGGKRAAPSASRNGRRRGTGRRRGHRPPGGPWRGRRR
jgi:hypothetical protein